MEGIKIVIVCVIAATVYGVLNNLVTAHLCIEFFRLFPIDIKSSNPIVIAIVFGVISTWWIGALLGSLVALSARIGQPPKLQAIDVLRPIGILMLVVAS